MSSALLFAFLAPNLTALRQDVAPAARLESDTKSVDSTIKALYDVISGGVGVKRDWPRFHNLFAADARMAAVVKAKDGSFRTFTFTPKQYEERSAAALEESASLSRKPSASWSSTAP